MILVGLCASTTAAIWSAKLGYSDILTQQQSIEGLTRAISTDPDRSVNYVNLAILISDIDPSRAHWALSRAVEVNPFEASSLIELGLLAESEGDLEAAERYLLQASQVDLQYLPRWTLANFYFRRGDQANFWKWAKAAAEMIYGDHYAAFFRLCGEMSEDGRAIERLKLTNTTILAKYVTHLVNQNHLDVASNAIEMLLRKNRREDVSILLDACDRGISSGLIGQATSIWNTLARNNRIADAPVGVDGLVSKAATLRDSEISRGFAWRLRDLEGIAASFDEAPPGLKIDFAGTQSEKCEPIYRYLPVEGGSTYELSLSHSASDLGSRSGLRWSVFEEPGGALIATSDELSSDHETRSIMSFTPSRSCRLIRVALTYSRSSGTTRIQGSFTLRDMELARAK